jgi:ABC-type antimicrobial peptide transport system permease subunit
VSDVRQYGIDKPPIAEIYTPLTQTPGFAAQVLVRTDGDPMRLVTALKAAVHSVDDQAPVDHITTIAELKSAQLQSPALTTVLLTAFAILALGITVAGLGAVIATSVSQRTREFGLRMALGASRGSVLGMVMKQGALMLSVGLVLGIGGAITFSHALTQYLYQTPPTDPGVYLGVALVFLVAGAIACLGPARRATSIDPLTALRTE